MTEYLTEQEQIEQLKNWLKQYGPTIIAGIILAMAIVTCWHYWIRHQNKILTHASSNYDEMLMLRAQNNTNGATNQAQKLLNDYTKTPYAAMAALTLARVAVNNKNYAEAINQLNWVIDHSRDNAIREIARTRIARINLTENKPDEALALLEKVDDTAFMGLIDELKGDAYLLKKDTAKAKESYQLALQELPKEEVSQRPILQMKLDNLATAST